MLNIIIIVDSPHFGRGRRVAPEPTFHQSVKLRMHDSKLKYKPKARYEKGTETYVPPSSC